MRHKTNPPSRRTSWTLWASLMLSGGLASCATQQVERFAVAEGPSVYQLQGNRPEALQAQAARLCPQGHETLLASQRGDRFESDPLWLRTPVAWVGDQFDARGIRARLMVRCLADAAAAGAAPSSPVGGQDPKP